MTDSNLFLLFTGKLEAAGFEYMVTGSAASTMHGEPRLTNDIDLVLRMPEARCSEFASLFPADEFYCPPLEVIQAEIRRRPRGHFNLIHHATGFKAHMYPASTDSLHA